MRTSTGRAVFTQPEQLSEALGIPFSAEQLEAATADVEPGVIVAGAGSGKTTVMAARVVWLVGRGIVRPEQVLGLTFTRKAAAELSARIHAALEKSGVINRGSGLDQAEQVVMTYDAFAAAIVAEHGLKQGRETDHRLVTGASRFSLAHHVVTAASGPFEHLIRLRPGTVTERILKLDSEIQNHMVSHQDLVRHAALFQNELATAPVHRGKTVKAVSDATETTSERLELAELALQYRRLKQDRGLVEFADLMALAATLATQIPDVSAAMRREFSVVLLDEYQDTSSAQSALLKGLFSGATVDEGRGHPVTAVGDPFQAIYGWRGASASNIVEFAEDFPTATGPAKHYPLTVNRRSGRSVLELANDAAEPLHRNASLQKQATTYLKAADNAASASVWAASFDTWPQECAWISERIVELHSGADAVSWNQMAVLSRGNADLAEIYAQLSLNDVPVHIVGLGGLLHLPEIMDVEAMLSVVDDPTANPALVRLLTGPRWQIDAADLALLGTRANELAGRSRSDEDGLDAALAAAVAKVDPTDVVSLAEAMADPGNAQFSDWARGRFAVFSGILDTLRKRADEPLPDFVRRVIAALNLDIELAVNSPRVAAPHRQLDRFLTAVHDFCNVNDDTSIRSLLNYLDAERRDGDGLEQDTPPFTDAVQLLTIHRSKGLEWDVVFLPDLAKDVFPNERVTSNWVRTAAVVPSPLRSDYRSLPRISEVSKAGLDEYALALKADQRLSEDRLAYVGFTRARRIVVGSRHSWKAGLTKPRQESDYFAIVTRHAEKSGKVWCEAPPPTSVSPLTPEQPHFLWPTSLDGAAQEQRMAAVEMVEQSRHLYRRSGHYPQDFVTQLDDDTMIRQWDDDVERLIAERQRERAIRTVPLPSALSVSHVIEAYRRPADFARMLARPMPRKPTTGSQLGIRFHEWVQHRFGQTSLLDTETDEVPPSDIHDFDDFESVCRAFSAGQFAARQPKALEQPFTLMVGDMVVRGRIDAVFEQVTPGTYLVVDWKTGSREFSDPLQLACYRIAWAELCGVPIESVTAGFYYVRTDTLQFPPLLGRAELEATIAALGSG